MDKDARHLDQSPATYDDRMEVGISTMLTAAGPIAGASSNIKTYTKSSLQLGREMHAAYKAGLADNLNTFKEFTKIKGICPDFVDFVTKTI
ncbi:hypothetical protein [Pedobacter frigidisoli]|uniref:hypothetical protein n=1 Tax=Pedobacter frigidisoli TaxID=2530455 RepID=UPI00292FE9A7|nr:hypothetical protein [Pedobacter frigidisoli]